MEKREELKRASYGLRAIIRGGEDNSRMFRGDRVEGCVIETLVNIRLFCELWKLDMETIEEGARKLRYLI